MYSRIFKLILFAVLVSMQMQAQTPDRIEPLHWWTGMENHSLQLCLHGRNISEKDFSLSYQGVSIERKIATDNPNFVFLYLTIDEQAKAGKIEIQMKKGKKISRFFYELKNREEGSADRESFGAADNLYLLMPDRFVNGNNQNDSVPGYRQGVNRAFDGGRHGGDIAGITSKIPYMKDLGITALWTTPLFENNDSAYSYHHYGCSDYYKIDPRFGTSAELRNMKEIASQNGIKLILDIVPNHCSGGHWWMKDMPAKDWFNVWPEFTSSNYRISIWGDPHRSQADLKKLTGGWFAPNMPDFNLSNPLVFDYLTQAYIYWIEEVGYQGIRVDTYPYSDIKLASAFVYRIRNEYPKMNIVGECWMETTQQIAYYQSGAHNPDGFDSGLQSVMDFGLRAILSNVFHKKAGWLDGISAVYNHLALDGAFADPNLVMNFLDNHDVERIYNHYEDLDKLKMALTMLTTLRGYPQIYEGTEILLDGIPGSFEGARFDFPGGWKEDKRNAFDKEGRTSKENEVFNFLRKLLHLRLEHKALQDGKLMQFVPEGSSYVFFRYNEQERLMIVTNNDDVAIKLKLNRFAEMIRDSKSATNLIDGGKISLDIDLEVPAKKVLLLRLD